MFDTLRLNLQEVEPINLDKAKLKIFSYPKENQTEGAKYDLFVTTEGEIIQGAKAVLNTPEFNLTIFPQVQKETNVDKTLDIIAYNNSYKKYLTRSEVHIHEKYNANIFLSTSLPKLYSILKNKKDYNLKSLSESELMESTAFLDRTLRANGINTILDNATLSRIDLFSNVETNYSFEAYDFLFKNIYLSRKLNMQYDTNFYLFKNRQNQVAIYDKPRELKEVHKIYLDKNLTRFENRFLNKKKIFSTFKNTKVSDILTQRKEYLKEQQKMGNEIFKKDFVEAITLDLNHFENLIDRYKKTERSWYSSLIKDIGKSALLQHMDSKTASIILSDKANNRMAAARIKKDFRTINQKQILKTKKRSELYNELKDKFYNTLN